MKTPQLEERATLRAEEVANILGIGTRSLARYVKAGEFPKPIRLGRSQRFSKKAVLAWIERQGGAR
jgi:excisionase family DNA binding protein